jgi:hypothetical protein
LNENPLPQSISVCGFPPHCYSAMSAFLRESLQMLVTLFPLFEMWIPDEPEPIESRFPFGRDFVSVCARFNDPTPQPISVCGFVARWYSAIASFLHKNS